MKSRYLYIFIITCAIAPFSGCDRFEELQNQKDNPWAAPENPSEISAACLVDTRSTEKLATKTMDEWALIDQVTTRQLDANFLRIDEEVAGDNSGEKTYYKSSEFLKGGNPGEVNWEKAYLSEATVISSPDNTENIHYRSIIFSPKQTYNILTTVKDADLELYDTTWFYHTRMVGWYPRNCSLVQTDGTQQFQYSATYTDSKENFPKQDAYYTDTDNRKYKAVKFTGLDGSKDIMMSNVCEGQMWHDPRQAYCSANLEDNEPYRVPFGHYQEYHTSTGEFTTRYSNYFKFRHYLSGVRFWGFVPDQNTHSLDMWGKITDVMLLNQPTSVSVSIPEEPVYGADGNSLTWDEDADFSNAAQWGQAFDWGDLQNFSVQTGAMFGDDTNHSDEAYTVDFDKIDMNGVGDVNSAVYLGYSLVRPDSPVTIQIHTKYGVYVTTISNVYNYTNKSNVSATENIFKPGYYYDVYLSLQTDGTIAAIIEDRGTEKYYDLTRDVEVTISGETSTTVTTYKYANSYIVDPAQYDSDNDGKCDYDGFFFSALLPGNGEPGFLTYNSQSFYPGSSSLEPYSARLIWESSRLLVSNIELINGYVKFKVPGMSDAGKISSGKYTGAKGNAVIGVFDEDGNCIWSWHIWITDTPSDVAYTVSATEKVYLMDRNLGATYGGVPTSAAEALASYGLYYQWGRKDPSMGPSTYNYGQQDCSTAPYYDYASDEHNEADTKTFNYPSIQNSVENPMYMILPIKKSTKGYLYDWLFYGPENVLWGHNHTTNKTTKTIYDPCPYGYRVAAGEIETVMRNATCTAGTYGLSFAGDETIFFPFAGYKGVDKSIATRSMEWHYVGTKGDYQESTYNTSTTNGLYHRRRNYISSSLAWIEKQTMGVTDYVYAKDLSTSYSVLGSSSYTGVVNETTTNSGYVYTDWTNRRTAASVRCVKDTDFGTVQLTLSPAATTFDAGSTISVQMNASSSQSILTNVKFTVTHYVGDVATETVVTNVNPASASWTSSYTFEAPDADYLQSTTGVYTLQLVATNKFGITSTATADLTYNNAGTLSVDKTKFVAIGGTGTLNVTTNTTISSVTSSDETVATATFSGNVVTITGIKEGTSTITIKAAAANGYTAATATCLVTVAALQPQTLTFNQATATTTYGSTFTQIPSKSNSSATVTYTSSDTSIAAVNASTGEVTPVKAGTVTITATATADDYADATASYTLTINKASRTLSRTDDTVELELYGDANSVAPGSLNLNSIVTDPAGCKITYSLAANDYATLDGSTVSANTKYGSCTVTASAQATDCYEAASTTVQINVYAYVYTSSITSGESFVIASAKNSSGYMLASGTLTGSSVSSSGGIVTCNVPETSSFTLTSSGSAYKIQSNSNSNYLYRSNGTNIRWDTSQTAWYINNDTCYSSGSSTYYLYCNGTQWSLIKNNSSNKVYFFHYTCE